MTETFWIAIIVGIVSPVLTALLMNWSKRQERAEDRADRKAAAEALATVNTKIDGMLVERDKAKVLEGERKGVAAGVETAKVLAQGQREGAESERASVAAANPISVVANGISTRTTPDAEVPTKDKRVAAATERSADAQERVAKAAETKKD